MAEFVLRFACDNAAFGDDPSAEIARILKATGDVFDKGLRLPEDGDSDSVRDANGNRVGQWTYRDWTYRD